MKHSADALESRDSEAKDGQEAEETESESLTEATDSATPRAGEAVDCNPVNRDDDAGGDDAEEEAQPQRGMRDPGQPSAAERAEHDLTHIPMRPWCKHCVRGKAKDNPSLRLCGAYSENMCPRVRLDYCQLTTNTEEESEGSQENVEATEDTNGDDPFDTTGFHTEVDAEADVDKDGEEMSKSSITVLVMQESECRSVWAYQVKHKGASETWVIDQIAEDLETVGLQNDRVIVKSDQEPSASEVARAIAQCRSANVGTAVENSNVADSDSNATIERAIQDVEGQVRTLRSALEERIGMKIMLTAKIVPWMIRHAACLITRCRVRPSGHITAIDEGSQASVQTSGICIRSTFPDSSYCIDTR